MHDTLAYWLKMKGQRDAFVKLEMEARQAVIKDIFAPKGLILDEGTSTFADPPYVFKAVFRQNYKVVDNDKLNTFLQTLPQWQRQQLIKYTPTVMLTAYRQLDSKQLRQLKRALEITPGVPGLTAESK